MILTLALLGASLGAVERIPGGIAACQHHIQAQPALRTARVNGHLARTIADARWGWVVDKKDAQRWCRYGINRIRLDAWPSPPQGDPSP